MKVWSIFGIFALLLSVCEAYNRNAVTRWSAANCQQTVWQCAEFASRAAHAGGAFNGLDLGSMRWKGYNMRWVPDLKQAMQADGWRYAGSGTGNAGDILLYNNEGHAAVSRGGGYLDQANPARCNGYAAWGTREVWSK